ncbi:hypothetical protein CMQ_7659 [Grosmannia clavigera kw1407]|uniref:Uncharacterized protein n=1 Tax=Grosmannia clavigera (strain kw1407 / UAMH 11150) TaxID=655863 RepID=F0XNP4_GROCL|nr:uncharacterized protein CMQ_7659 [Grosmannia clavigera kw1407]EFX00657.1 hypothetical protein CMQ_7659 [Grosmannia clavigera kw1407]
MDSPPKKRRRTSPRLSDRASGNDSLMYDVNTAASATPPDPPRPSVSPSRPPSFASPTKASLARHNQDAFDRRQPMARSEANGRRGGPTVVSAAPPPSSHAETDSDAQRGARKNGAVGDIGEIRMAQSEQNIRPLARSPIRSPARSPTRRFGSTLSEPPRRSPVKPIPRPLPPPDPQRSEDVLQPLIALDRRRSGLDLFRGGDEPPEPELPPTPERPDPEMATPPSGIHNSTPTKHPGRRKGRDKKGRASSGSPLKQTPLKATALAEAEAGARLKDAAKRTKERPANTESSGRHSPRRLRSGHVARGIKPMQPDAELLAEKASLLAEIAQLEADLSFVAAENERIHSATVLGLEPSSPQNHRDIVSFLRRHVLPPEKEAPDPTADWLQAATNPIAFLPFGQPLTQLTKLFTFGQPQTEGTAEENPPISHHPIPMTAAEELPYLQAFSSLSFRSEVIVLPPAEPDAPLLQKHCITATSISPPDVFLARIEMIVNTKSLRIAELRVPKIDPTAAPELRPFIDRIALCHQKDAGSALVRNVTVLTWAMGEWVRVAVRRAKLWCALDQLVRDKEALHNAIQALRARKKRRYNNRRRDDSDTDDDDELGGDVPQKSSTFSATELHAHLGRTAMDVDIPLPQNGQGHDATPTVRIQWRIDFDWTGEAQSDLGLLLGVPGKWHKADDRGRLAGLPKLFDQLVHGSEDPETAVKTIVALLAGDDDSV